MDATNYEEKLAKSKKRYQHISLFRCPSWKMYLIKTLKEFTLKKKIPQI